MNTFRNKRFKNELDPKYAFYDYHRSCKIKSNSEKSLEECTENCEPSPASKNIINGLKKKNLHGTELEVIQ